MLEDLVQVAKTARFMEDCFCRAEVISELPDALRAYGMTILSDPLHCKRFILSLKKREDAREQALRLNGMPTVVPRERPEDIAEITDVCVSFEVAREISAPAMQFDKWFVKIRREREAAVIFE